MTCRSTFLQSFLASTVLFLIAFVILYHGGNVLDLHQVGPNVSVNGQIGVKEVAQLARWHFGTIIDCRPDGEDAAQTPSADIARAAADRGMAFLYLPIAHGEIPSDAVVAQLAAALCTQKPVLLYCRTGNRALRAYALVMASDPQGPDCSGILAMAHSAGHGVEDLRGAIQERIAGRLRYQGTSP